MAYEISLKLKSYSNNRSYVEISAEADNQILHLVYGWGFDDSQAVQAAIAQLPSPMKETIISALSPPAYENGNLLDELEQKFK